MSTVYDARIRGKFRGVPEIIEFMCVNKRAEFSHQTVYQTFKECWAQNGRGNGKFVKFSRDNFYTHDDDNNSDNIIICSQECP